MKNLQIQTDIGHTHRTLVLHGYARHVVLPGTPVHRNTGTPEHRNITEHSGTPEKPGTSPKNLEHPKKTRNTPKKTRNTSEKQEKCKKKFKNLKMKRTRSKMKITTMNRNNLKDPGLEDFNYTTIAFFQTY